MPCPLRQISRCSRFTASIIPLYRAFTLVVTIAVLGVLYGLLKGTRIGTTVRASLSHPEMVNALGHNLPRLRTNVFALGSALAGLAGALSGNIIGTEPGMAAQLGGILMIVVVVGGLGFRLPEPSCRRC